MKSKTLLFSLLVPGLISCAEPNYKKIKIEPLVTPLPKVEQVSIQNNNYDSPGFYELIKQHEGFEENNRSLMNVRELEEIIDLENGLLVTKISNWEKVNSPNTPYKIFVDFQNESWGVVDYEGSEMIYSGPAAKELERSIGSLIRKLKK